MEVIELEQKERWNQILDMFPEADIYYKNEYVRSLLKDSKGRGVLFYFRKNSTQLCYPMIIRDIAYDHHFENKLPEGKYFDMEVPYGYGGPIGKIGTEAEALEVKEELAAWCQNNGIVSQFVRFHPVLQNEALAKQILDKTAYVHHTVAVDTTDKEMLMQHMDSKKRNMVRKAEKNGVSVVIDEKMEAMGEFRKIYTSTMDQHHADQMYYFSKEYFEYLKHDFAGNTILLYALYEGKKVAASLFFYDNKSAHYHLSGSLYEYRRLAATDLLLYRAFQWASDRGIEKFHLGGGMSENDSLYEFKKGFCKNGTKDFYIGRTIFIQETYDKLVDIRRENDCNFAADGGRMILYRK